MKIKQALLIPSLVYLASCASGSLKVTTVPEKADVFMAYDGGQATRVGETPLNIAGELLSRKKGSYVSLLLKKEGYQTESVVVPTSYFGADLAITSKMDEYKLSMQCHDQTQALQKVSKGTASVQSLISANRLGEALQQVDALLSEYYNLSVLYDLKGNILYLTKDLNGALGAYERSLELDPSNTDTMRMRTKLRGILGERAPAARGGN